jgi:hypothetical protein
VLLHTLPARPVSCESVSQKSMDLLLPEDSTPCCLVPPEGPAAETAILAKL